MSTDSPEIAAVGKDCGVEVPYLRPESISGDATPSIDVVLHALDWLKENDGWLPDAVVLLQPTSPLRTTSHIDDAIKLFHDTGADTVVSVIPVPHRFHPYSVMQCDSKGLLLDFMKPEERFDKYRRQELPVLFARNGPAVLITKTDTLKTAKDFTEKGSFLIQWPRDIQLILTNRSTCSLRKCYLNSFGGRADVRNCRYMRT